MFILLGPSMLDNVNADGKLLHKQGMHRLAPQDNAKYEFSIQPF